MDVYFSSDKALLEQMGKAIRRRRIAAKMTQKQLSEQAVVALSAVGNIEKGKNSSVLTLIQVLRTLQSLDLLEPFFKEEEISPIAYAEAMRKHRQPQRVRKSNTTNLKTESEW